METISFIFTLVQRFTAILILFLVSFQTMGYLLLLLSRVQEVRKEMAANLPENTEETLMMTEKAYQEQSSGKTELRHDGNLYDVVRKTALPNGMISVKIVRDAKEQRFLEAIGVCFKPDRMAAGDQPVSFSFAQLLTQVFLIPADAIERFASASGPPVSIFHPMPVLVSFEPGILSPPPEV
jgi:hypothetical protein